MRSTGATTTCNGTAPRMIISSTTTGTCRSKAVTSTKTACRTPTARRPWRSTRQAEPRSRRSIPPSMGRAWRSAATPPRCVAGPAPSAWSPISNYSPDPLNNFSLRPEYYHDPQGQRTGTKADDWELTLGWQHWLSPQIEFRPEVGHWAADRDAFNGNPTHGITPNNNHPVLGAVDVIAHPCLAARSMPPAWLSQGRGGCPADPGQPLAATV